MNKPIKNIIVFTNGDNVVINESNTLSLKEKVIYKIKNSEKNDFIVASNGETVIPVNSILFATSSPFTVKEKNWMDVMKSNFEVKINKEIRDYTESILFGLSLRQIIFLIPACGYACIIYFLCSNKLGHGYNPGFTGNGWNCVNQLIEVHPDSFERSLSPKPGSVFSGIGVNHVGIVIAVDVDNVTIQ